MNQVIIPEPALLQHIAILGKTGSGKTFAAKGSIVEPLLEAGHHVCILDPTDAWSGLRSSRDGKGSGFKILVLGGDHGDLPLTPNGGAAVGRLVVEQGVSLVACTKHLMVGERTRWFIDFAGVVSRLNKSRLHLIIDEAHNFAPQGKVPDPDTGRMLHLANSLASEGRSKRICLTVLTQRPQKLHKDTLTSADTLIAMRVLAPQDRQAVKEWIDGAADQTRGKEVLASLAGLQRGEGWVWYPEGDHLQRVKFPRIKTFDSSAGLASDSGVTPKAAEIDLTEIQAALADAVKEAEANDPKILRKRIAALEAEARKTSPIPAPAEIPAPVEVSVLTENDRAAILCLADLSLNERLASVESLLHHIREDIDHSSAEARAALQKAAAVGKRPVYPKQVTSPARASIAAKPVTRTSGDLKGPEQRVLNALAELEAIGARDPERVLVAFFSGYSNLNSKGFTNAIGALSSGGQIVYPRPGFIAITDRGRASAVPSETPATPKELQDRVVRMLGGASERLLRPLIDAYPDPIERGALAAKADYGNVNSKGFTNAIGRLRSLGFIDYPARGRVAAQPVLFLEGR